MTAAQHKSDTAINLDAAICRRKIIPGKLKINPDGTVLAEDVHGQVYRSVLYVNGEPQPAQPDHPEADNDNLPADLWAEAELPALPSGKLPPVIEEFARSRAEQIGIDPGGIAVATLAVCGSAITDAIKLKVKRHDDDWFESSRLWVALVGPPSAKKTPAQNAAAGPIREIEAEYQRDHAEALREWNALDKKTRESTPKPIAKRVCLMDTTPEKAGEILKNNPDGLLLDRDELSGWFGGMMKYAGKGSGADRAFWLQAYNGGSYAVDRINRESIWIPNLSMSVLGGIQPGPIRSLARHGEDDGLLQRFTPIIVGPSGHSKDEPAGLVAKMYSTLVRRLHKLRPPTGSGTLQMPRSLRFDEGAQAIFDEVSRKNEDLQRGWESVSSRLAAHFGKYDGMFARLCVIWHCVECAGESTLSHFVTEDTARRAADFLHGYLLRHAIAFYRNVVGLTDDHDYVLAVAGWILAKRLDVVSVSEAMRGDRIRSNMDEHQAAQVLSRLDALGWLNQMPLERNQKSPRYKVNGLVHTMFEDRAEREAIRRAEVRALIGAT